MQIPGVRGGMVMTKTDSCKSNKRKIKDACDRKILQTEFFKSSVYYYSSYTLSKIVTDERIFRVYEDFGRER